MPKKSQNTLTDLSVNKAVREQKEKNELIDLEKFYVNGQLENLDQLVELKKNELVNKIEEFNKLKEENAVNPYNPYLISTYFFKTINPIPSIEPEYSAEKLGIVWQLYMYLIEQVNIKIGMMQPSISHFCKFAGISMGKFKSLKSTGTYEMQVLLNKISDATFDSNVLLAQNKVLSNRSTELRVKVENEVQETPQVHVNVNVNEDVNLEQIASRIKELSNFKTTKEELKDNIVEGELDNE